MNSAIEKSSKSVEVWNISEEQCCKAINGYAHRGNDIHEEIEPTFSSSTYNNQNRNRTRRLTCFNYSEDGHT